MSKQIVLCNTCEGEGEVNNYSSTFMELYKPEGPVKCPICKGSGRMIKEITFVPYKNKKGIN
jgi:DnaJ-class molecular chaperone